MEPLNLRYERSRISALGWGLALALAVTIAAELDLSFLAAAVSPAVALSSEGSVWIAAAAQFCLGYPACILMMTKVPSDPLERYNLRPGQIADAAFILCFVLLAGDLIGLGVNQGITLLLGHETENVLIETLDSTSLLYSVITTVIAAPVFEELIFRKLFIDRTNRLGDRAAILLSAFLFAMIHGNFYQFFYAFGAGLVFGYIYVRTGKIRYTIGLHMAVNLVFGLFPTVFYDMEAYLLAGVWDIALIILAIVGLVRFIVRFRHRRLLRGWIALPKNRWAYIAFPNVGMAACLIVCVALFVLNLL